MNVTVLSMLARLGLDPWTEASELAAMPDGPARKRLDALMTRFKDVPAPRADRGKTISALLAFLPGTIVAAKLPSHDDAAKPPSVSIGVPIYWIVAAVVFLGWLVNLAQGN